jgi:hypothetical protein
MATFSEWMFFEDIREGVYEESMRRIRLQEALKKTFEFCNLAVMGRWDLILESSLDDDGPAELDDPFAGGDENAKPVELPGGEPPMLRRPKKKKKRSRSELAPHERRVRYRGWSPPKDEEDEPVERPDSDTDDDAELDFDLTDEVPESELVKQAKEIQRLYRMARWGAMLDRRDLVDRVRRIYEDELVPLLRQNEWLHLEDSSDDDDWGVSYFAPKTAPNKQTAPARPDIQTSIYKVAERLKPLLEKLGYLRDSHLPDRLTDKERSEVIIAKAEVAKDETGNNPEVSARDDAEYVKRMEENPALRREQYSRVMDKLSAIMRDAARRAFNKTSATVQDSEGRTRRGASRFLDDEFLNDGILRAIETITTRDVLKDGKANPWSDETNAFKIKIEDEESAQRYINSLKSPITRGSLKRDADRDDMKGAGMSPGSEARPVSMDASVAGSDGEASSMQVADPRGRDSLSSSVAEESKKTLVNAFRQAMIELRDSKPNGPSLAVIACLWMQLDCAGDGSIPDGNITRFFSAASGLAAGSRKSSETFINRLALDQHIPGMPKQKSELGDWALVKLIVARRTELGGMARMNRMPPGTPPDRPPSAEGKSAYMSRHLLGGSDRMWYDYLKKVSDAKRDAIKFVVDRMSYIIAENDPSTKPKGWRSPCSWSIFKFLKDTYHDELGKGVSIGDRESDPMTVTFFNKHKKGQKIREYSISTSDGSVSIMQTYPPGFEGDVFRYEIPRSSIKCDTCGGAGGDCPECEGCGSMMDRIKTISLERDIKSRLELQRRKRV